MLIAIRQRVMAPQNPDIFSSYLSSFDIERSIFWWLRVFRSKTVLPNDVLSMHRQRYMSPKCRVGQMSVGRMIFGLKARNHISVSYNGDWPSEYCPIESIASDMQTSKMLFSKIPSVALQ
jgi:hypothetical protein